MNKWRPSEMPVKGEEMLPHRDQGRDSGIYIWSHLVMRFQPLTLLYLLEAMEIQSKLSIQHENKKLFPPKNGLCAVFHGFAQWPWLPGSPRVMQVLAPRSASTIWVPIHTPRLWQGLSWTRFPASVYLSGRQKLSYLTGMCLPWKFLKPVTKCIFVFFFYSFGFHRETTVGQREQLHFNPIGLIISVINQVPISSSFLKVQLYWSAQFDLQTLFDSDNI